MMVQPISIFNKNIQVDILREDLRHPHISGNKWWKLKYNIEEAKRLNASCILTFGGAYSNHLAATAAAGKENNIATVGVVRGEKVDNATIRFCKEQGMELHFVSRADYRLKKHCAINGAFVIPEGGANTLGVKGCTEILQKNFAQYNYIVSACGTGGTLSGLIISALPHQKVIGFPVLKGGVFLVPEIKKFIHEFNCISTNWELKTEYHFGGYAKVNASLISFIQEFKKKYDIPLDGIYTGKMMYGLMDLVQGNYFPENSKILVVHTGGIQGNKGIKERFGVDI